MTNRDMVKPKDAPDPLRAPGATPAPPMPAPEDSDRPTTREEPVDSPQPNASADRAAPTPARPGLATRR